MAAPTSARLGFASPGVDRGVGHLLRLREPDAQGAGQVEQYLYGPLEVGVRAVVRTAKRLQSGRLDAYMTYMLIALVAVLAVVTATS